MYKAIKSFSGLVSMKKGEIKDLKDAFIIKDLLNAGYIEEIKEEVKKVETKVKEEVKEIKAEVKEIKAEVKPQAKTKKKKSK